jgi:putative DNA primase/helicase
MAYEHDINFGESDQPPLSTELKGWDDIDPIHDPGSPDRSSEVAFSPVNEDQCIPPSPPVSITPAGARPVALISWYELHHQFPRELLNRRQWGVWGFEWDGKSWRKRPYLPIRKKGGGGYPASPSRPEKWGKYSDAWGVAKNDPRHFSGVGFLFTADDPFIGGDLDKCLSADGTLAGWAGDILSGFPGAYVELSPSGTGLKFWVKAALTGSGVKVGGFGAEGRGAVELYSERRFFTVTGLAFGEAATIYADYNGRIPDHSEAALDLYRMLQARNAARPSAESRPTKTSPQSQSQPVTNSENLLSDDQVTAKARATYSEFGMLFDTGDLSQHDNDWSRADAALVKQIAYFALGEREQIERIWGMSALANREKFERDDYREATIEAVLSRMTKFYDSKYRSKGCPPAAGGSTQWGVVR